MNGILTMLIRILMLFLIACSVRASAQDYCAYQRVINRCDNDIVAGDFLAALRRMDTIDRGYRFVYARHCLKAAQIAYRAGDSERAAGWVRRGLLQGVPAWVVRQNPLCRESLRWPLVSDVLLQADSLHRVYLSRIDTALAREIGELSRLDAWYTRRVNDGFLPLRKTLYGLQWVRNNTRQVRRLERIIRERGYPEEKLIGLPAALLDSAANAGFMRRAGMDLTVQNRQVFFMFLHYFSTKRNGLNELLMPQIAIGNMPPYQYARLNDYLHRATSTSRYPPYFDQRPIPEGADTTGLAARRFAIGLSTPAEGQRNRDIRLRLEFSGRGDEGVSLE